MKVAQDHALKQSLYAASDEVHALLRAAAQEAARGNHAAADDLLYQAGVKVDAMRDALPEDADLLNVRKRVGGQHA